MRIKLLVLLCIITMQQSFAQTLNSNDKRQEIGVAFRSLNNFGAYYRIGNDRGLWRLGIDGSTYSNVDEMKRDTVFTNQERVANSFSIRVGREQRITLAKKLQLRLGGDLGYRRFNDNVKREFSNNNITDSKTDGNGFEVLGLIGINYQVNDYFHVGFELRPTYTVSKLETKYFDNTGSQKVNTKQNNNLNRFDFNASSVQLNIGFNF